LFSERDRKFARYIASTDPASYRKSIMDYVADGGEVQLSLTLGLALGVLSGRGGRRPPASGKPQLGPKLENPGQFPPELVRRLDNIKDPNVRGAVDRLITGGAPEKRKIGHGDDYVVVKSGGNEAGLREYLAAVKSLGGTRGDIKRISKEKTILRYTARDGTRIMFRRRLPDKDKTKDTTNEIHFESADKKIRLKVRCE
jgi:hypothetical protein